MHFFLTRHTETEWNRDGIIQGHCDSPLTEEGVSQIESLGLRLRERGINKIISSDLGRCVQSSEILGQYLHASLETTSLLREQDFGVLNGAKKADTPHAWLPMDEVYEGGESFLQMRERVVQCILSVLGAEVEVPVLFVGHDGTIKSLLTYVYKCDMSELPHKVRQGQALECVYDNGGISVRGII